MKNRPKRDSRLFTLRSGMASLVEALADKVHIEYGKEPKEADVVFSTAPQPEHVEYAQLNVVHLGFEDAVLRKRGFGYLVPSRYHQDVLGVVFDSCVFPQQNRTQNETRLSVMLKDCPDPLESALRAVREHLNIRKLPHEVLISNYPQAVAQMTLGHNTRMEKLQKEQQDVVLAGSYLSSPAVNACVKQAQALSLQALLQADQSAPVYA